MYPSLLGKAAFSSSIPAEHAHSIYRDLKEARDELILESDLHLLYLITPHFRNLQEPNWDVFIKQFQRLTVSELELAKKYKIEIEFIFRA